MSEVTTAVKKTMAIKSGASSKTVALNPVGIKETHGFLSLKSKESVNGNHHHFRLRIEHILFHSFKSILHAAMISANYNTIFNLLNNMQCFFSSPKKHKSRKNMLFYPRLKPDSPAVRYV